MSQLPVKLTNHNSWFSGSVKTLLGLCPSKIQDNWICYVTYRIYFHFLTECCTDLSFQSMWTDNFCVWCMVLIIRHNQENASKINMIKNNNKRRIAFSPGYFHKIKMQSSITNVAVFLYHKPTFQRWWLVKSCPGAGRYSLDSDVWMYILHVLYQLLRWSIIKSHIQMPLGSPLINWNRVQLTLECLKHYARPTLWRRFSL